MRAKGVIFHNTSPVGIDHLFSIFLRSDAVFPVIFIRKTSSRPAKHRNPDCSQGLCNIVPDAVGIGNGRILPHINSVVNAAAQMFGKMSVNFRMNPAFSVIGVYNIFCHEIASPLFLICFLPFGLPSFIVSFFAFSLSLSLPYPGLLSLLFVFVPPCYPFSFHARSERKRSCSSCSGRVSRWICTNSMSIIRAQSLSISASQSRLSTV